MKVHRNDLSDTLTHKICVAACCIVLQCIEMCCNVLKRVAVCCSVLQCVAVCCSVLHLNTLHHTATHCNALLKFPSSFPTRYTAFSDKIRNFLKIKRKKIVFQFVKRRLRCSQSELKHEEVLRLPRVVCAPVPIVYLRECMYVYVHAVLLHITF